MAKKKRTISSIRKELIAKSREASLCAIRTFNDPQVSFKSETYIVLMVIAWTYLLHAYYRSVRIEYRYYRRGPKRKLFDRTKRGAYKYWELERCLNESKSPIDKNTSNNLRFLIGLRNEIEHQMTQIIDNYLSGRYQACALNYNFYLKKLFGDKYGIDNQLTYSIQFIQLTEEQVSGPAPEAELPARLRAYIASFDNNLSEEEFNDLRFSYRMIFTRKLVNRPGQADNVVEFIDPKSELGKKIDEVYWVKKEVEHPKFRPSDVVVEVQKAGFLGFRINPEHVKMWKEEDGKNPAKGYGVEIQGTWYWYRHWIDRCIELCKAAGKKYREPKKRG